MKSILLINYKIKDLKTNNREYFLANKIGKIRREQEDKSKKINKDPKKRQETRSNTGNGTLNSLKLTKADRSKEKPKAQNVPRNQKFNEK